MRLHVVVAGRVQGVAFRAHTAAEGRRLGLTGWVRNLSDGRVEVTAEGPRDVLESFLAWCGHGPRLARVIEVVPTWSDASGDLGGFEVIR